MICSWRRPFPFSWAWLPLGSRPGHLGACPPSTLSFFSLRVGWLPSWSFPFPRPTMRPPTFCKRIFLPRLSWWSPWSPRAVPRVWLTARLTADKSSKMPRPGCVSPSIRPELPWPWPPSNGWDFPPWPVCFRAWPLFCFWPRLPKSSNFRIGAVPVCSLPRRPSFSLSKVLFNRKPSLCRPPWPAGCAYCGGGIAVRLLPA